MSEKRIINERLVSTIEIVVCALGGVEPQEWRYIEHDEQTGLVMDVRRNSSGDITATAHDPEHEYDAIRATINGPEWLFQQRG